MFRCRKTDCRFHECELWRPLNELVYTDLTQTDGDGHVTAFDAMDPDALRPFEELLGDSTAEGQPARRLRLWSEDALQCLTHRQRQAVILYREGKTQAESAQIMGITQPRYHQLRHGENGQGGAFRRLRKYLVSGH